MTGFWSVARAVGWRNIHNFFTNPAIIVPSLLFPMFHSAPPGWVRTPTLRLLRAFSLLLRPPAV